MAKTEAIRDAKSLLQLDDLSAELRGRKTPFDRKVAMVEEVADLKREIQRLKGEASSPSSS